MRSARWVASHDDLKPTQAKSIRQVHRFISAMRLDGTDYAVTLTVKEFEGGRLGLELPEVLKFYHHRVEKKMPAGISRKSQWGGPSRPTADTTPPASQAKADAPTKLQRPIENEVTFSVGEKAESVNIQESYTVKQLISGVRNSTGRPYLVGEGDLRQWQAARTAEFERMREKLAQDVMGYFADETGYAVLEPDAKTRAAMYRGTKPGSLTGEMLRFAWQFKAFPVTFWQRTMAEGHWQRASRQPVGGFSSWHERFTGDIPAFIHFALATTALGYVSTSVPPDLRNLGVITGQAARGNLDAAGETAVRNATNTLSYANLWQTRSGMDYLLHSHLHEMMSPGALARSERRMKDVLAAHHGVQYQRFSNSA